MRAQPPGPEGLARRADKACYAQPLASGLGTASLVIGIGNPLRSDDGIGWRLAALLPAQPGLAVCCRQQLTPELAAELAVVQRVLFLDAWLEPSSAHPRPRLLKLQELGAPDGPGRSLQVWAGATPWGGASHGLSPQVLLALSQALYGQAPRAHQLLLPAHCFGHGDGISPALARRLGEARRLIEAWIAAGSALQGGGHA